MIHVSIEVGSGAACFSASVRAESLERAVSIVETLYPGSEARVVFPIDPEPFFVRDPVSEVELVEIEIPQSIAG